MTIWLKYTLPAHHEGPKWTEGCEWSGHPLSLYEAKPHCLVHCEKPRPELNINRVVQEIVGNRKERASIWYRHGCGGMSLTHENFMNRFCRGHSHLHFSRRNFTCPNSDSDRNKLWSWKKLGFFRKVVPRVCDIPPHPSFFAFTPIYCHTREAVNFDIYNFRPFLWFYVGRATAFKVVCRWRGPSRSQSTDPCPARVVDR